MLSTEFSVAKPPPTCYNSTVRRVGISVLQRLPKPLRRVRLPYPAPKKVHDESRGLFLASTRRSASRLDSNYLTAEVNSAYNNSPLRCELTRDFARGTRGILKCSGEVNSPCANAFAQQKHFTAQKRRGNGVGRSACADWECAALLPRSGNARWSAGLMTMDAASIETAGRSCPVGQFAMGCSSNDDECCAD